jgi:radical SAM superfamily enzyme YgiQ (UPF0313 family)
LSKVFFISANTSIYPYIVFPLGMAIVSRAIVEAGHELRQFDYLASGKSMQALGEALRQYAPDHVLISIRNIDNVDSTADSSDWQLDTIREMVCLAKQTTAAKVICGGPGFSVMPGPILEYIGADHGIVGEGEYIIAGILEKLGRGQELPALILPDRSTDQQDRTSLQPYCDPSLIEFYSGQTGIFNLLTKRGCSFRCAYCTYPTIDGKQFRPKAIDEVIDCIDRVKEEHDIHEFFFTDSVFNDPQGYYLKFAQRLIERRTGIRWTAFFTPRDRNLDQLPMLKQAGLFAVELGTDAASDATLRGLRKGFTFDEVEAFNEACVEQKLFTAHYVIFGGPGETRETLEEGIQNLMRLRSCVVFAFSGIRILPDTEIHRLAVEQGMMAPQDSLLKPRYYFSPDIQPEFLNERLTHAFRRNPTRVFPPRDGQIMSSMLRNSNHKGLLWDKLIRFPDN